MPNKNSTAFSPKKHQPSMVAMAKRTIEIRSSVSPAKGRSEKAAKVYSPGETESNKWGTAKPAQTMTRPVTPHSGAHLYQSLFFRLSVAVCGSNGCRAKTCLIGKESSGDTVSGRKEEGTAKKAAGDRRNGKSRRKDKDKGISQIVCIKKQ